MRNKEKLNNMKNSEFQILRGDVVYAETSIVDEHIQCGRRPYMIISNNFCNRFADVVIGIPFTTAIKKKNLPTHYTFYWNKRYNTAMCEQPTLIHKDRIVGYVSTLADKHIKEIEERVKIQLDLKGE